MLALHLTTHLKATKDASEDNGPIYFFCTSQSGKNTGTSILLGLLYQLLKRFPWAYDHLSNHYESYRASLFEEGRFEPLWTAFLATTQDARMPTTSCILDGLDECNEDSLEDLWSKIGQMFPTLDDTPRRKPKHHLKLIVVSRNNPFSIERAMQPFPRLDLERDAHLQIRNGISKYIEVPSQELACPEETRQYVKEKLLANSQGTYLWIEFAINALRKVRVIDIEDTVAELPFGLDVMYRRMIMAIPKRKRPRVLALLQWVTAVYRPLTLQELGAAIETKAGRGQSLEEAIIDEISYAGDMLIVSDIVDPYTGSPDTLWTGRTAPQKSRAVVPVHSSLTDFLAEITNVDELLLPYQLGRASCHQHLHRRTLDYIFKTLSPDLEIVFYDQHLPTPPRAPWHDGSVDSDSSSHTSQVSSTICYIRDFPLLRYSLEYGLRHLEDSQVQSDQLDPSHALLDSTHPTHAAWIRAQACILTRLHTSIRPKLPHIAALFGRVRTLRHLLCEDPSCVDLKDDHGRTPLFYAAFQNQFEAAACLIEYNADPLLQDDVEQTALHIAVVRSHCDTVNLLLSKGAHLDVNGTGQRGSVYSMLHGCDPVVDDGESTSIRWIGTPLHLGARFASPECLRLLLLFAVSSGANTGVLNERNETVLHIAARRPRFSEVEDIWPVLRELADIVRSVDTLQTDTNGRTALHVAAARFRQTSETVKEKI
jgi:ankyrin repeat protein